MFSPRPYIRILSFYCKLRARFPVQWNCCFADTDFRHRISPGREVTSWTPLSCGQYQLTWLSVSLLHERWCSLTATVFNSCWLSLQRKIILDLKNTELYLSHLTLSKDRTVCYETHLYSLMIHTFHTTRSTLRHTSMSLAQTSRLVRKWRAWDLLSASASQSFASVLFTVT